VCVIDHHPEGLRVKPEVDGDWGVHFTTL